MMRRTGFKKPTRPERQAPTLAALTVTPNYGGSTSGEPIVKDPHTVNPHFRNLARGESCTGRRYGSYCHCDPATTVLAHTNSLADQKGFGYKASDHLGAFLGFDCHSWFDQGKGTAAEKAAFMAAAQALTRERIAVIAADGAARPWKRAAAQWGLDRLAGIKE